MVDETALSDPTVGTAIAPVELVPVTDPVSIMRVGTRVVVLVGSGDGVVDAAAAGLLQGDEALFYAADLTGTDDLHVAAVIITDSNRDRAHHWRSSQDVNGFTESGGPTRDVLRNDEADQRVPVFGQEADADDQTIAFLDADADGRLVVQATGYGEPFAYRPEQRPAMAVDGNPSTAWVVGDHGDPIGHFITVSDNDGTIRLLQPQYTTANRMITSVRVTAPNDWTADVALDDSSLSGFGQSVDVPASGTIKITITGVGPRAGGTDSRLSGVGFAELGLGTHIEVVRVPVTAVAAGVDVATAVVLTRLHVDPRNRWRSDPEPTMEREFVLLSAHDFALTVQLQRNDRAPDATLDALDHVFGATADRRLTGVPSARGRFATDGDPDTAWTSPFGATVGSTLTVPLDGTPLTQIGLQQAIDDGHSAITAVRVAGAGAEFDLTVAPPNESGISVLTLPTAITGNEMALTVTAVSAKTTTDRRFGEPISLPVAIRELSASSIVPPVTIAHGSIENQCNNALLSIDGQPVPLRLTASDETALAAGTSVTVAPCAPVTLAAGRHRLSSSNGLLTGLDVDQIVFDDGVADGVADGAATTQAAPAVSVQRARTTRTATVAACPVGCWLIMGEGYNTGWEAFVGGESLGEPRQIAGGFNGWWLPPSSAPTTVDIKWGAQTAVNYALAASAVAVLGCTFLAARRRRKSATFAEWSAAPPRFDRALLDPIGRKEAMIAAGILVALTLLVVPLPMAAVVLLPAAAIVLLRRPFVAGVAAVLLFGALSAAVTLGQLIYGFAGHGGWPTSWDRVHGLGLMVTTLLLAATFKERSSAERHEQ